VSVVATQINLEVACESPQCSEFAWPLYKQLEAGNYDRMSVAPIQELGDWMAEHRTARKRAMRCTRRGYKFIRVRPADRNDELFAINTSSPERQGRPMSAGYRQPPVYTDDPFYPCPRHAIRRYGVEHQDGTLVAYLWLYRAGELALVSSILGHARHLENEVMYLLWAGMIDCESAEPGGWLTYNRWDSGQDGLRFYKERVGLSETAVTWNA
jgi:hypothetical protein